MSGSVSLRKNLDYETLDASKQIMTVVLAISADKIRTSTATLIVNVLDVNDNEPKFDKDVCFFVCSVIFCSFDYVFFMVLQFWLLKRVSNRLSNSSF